MTDDKLQCVLRLIDAANAEDPNRELWQGREYPKEVLYGMRMTEWLERLRPDAPDPVKIAARGQHIRRWEVPRHTYPDSREGYLKWRIFLYGFHAERVAELMRQAGYDESAIERAKQMLYKRGLKTDADVQSIEDTACLVFIEHYLPAFAIAQDADKLGAIIRKTWNKMSEPAQQQALTIPHPEPVGRILAAALGVG